MQSGGSGGLGTDLASGCASVSTSTDSGVGGGVGTGTNSAAASFSYYRPSSCSELLYGDVDPLSDASLSIRFDDMPDDDYDDFRSAAYGKLVIGGYTVRRREACLLAAAALLLVACVALVACFSIRGSDTSASPTQQVSLAHTNGGTCRRAVCLQESARVVVLMNRSVSPCTDMAAFACGGFGVAHPLAEGEAHVEALDVVLARTDAALLAALEADVDERRHRLGSLSVAAKMRRIYRSCVHDVAGVRQRGRPLLALIRAAGGWGASSADWPEERWSVAEAVRVASAVYGVDVFFGTRRLVGADVLDGSQPLLKVTYPVVHDRAFFLYGTSYEEKVVETHRSFLNATATLLLEDLAGGDATLTTGHTQSAKRRGFVADALYMEHRLHSARLAAMQTTVPNASGKEQLVTVGSLQQTFHWLNWLEFTRSALPSSVNVTKDTKLLLDCADYLHSVSLVIDSTPKRCLNNLLVWKMMREFVPFLSLDYQQALEDFRTNVHVGTYRPPRLRCLHFLATSAVRRGLLALLDDSDPAGRHNIGLVERVVSDVREALSDKLNWKNETTSTLVRNKLKTIRTVPEMSILNDEGALDDFYSELEVTDVYFDNVLRVRNFERHRAASATISRGRGDAMESVIVLPHHLTSPPFVDAAYPRFLLYGRLATLLTTELLRLLRNSGIADMVGASVWNGCAITGQMESTGSDWGRGQNRSDHRQSSWPELLLHAAAVQVASRAFGVSTRRVPEDTVELDGILVGIELTLEQGFYLAAAQLHCEISDPIYRATAVSLGILPGHLLISRAIAGTRGFASAYGCEGTYQLTNWGRSLREHAPSECI